MITIHLPSRMRETLNYPKKATKLSSTENGSLLDLVDTLNQAIPGASEFLMAEQDTVRKHICFFLDDEQITDPLSQTQLEGDEHIRIIQAMAGG